eukprot:g44535.t1
MDPNHPVTMPSVLRTSGWGDGMWFYASLQQLLGWRKGLVLYDSCLSVHGGSQTLTRVAAPWQLLTMSAIVSLGIFGCWFLGCHV